MDLGKKASWLWPWVVWTYAENGWHPYTKWLNWKPKTKQPTERPRRRWINEVREVINKSGRDWIQVERNIYNYKSLNKPEKVRFLLEVLRVKLKSIYAYINSIETCITTKGVFYLHFFCSYFWFVKITQIAPSQTLSIRPQKSAIKHVCHWKIKLFNK